MAEKDTYLAIENAVEQLDQAPAIVQEKHKLKSLRTGLRTTSMYLKELDGTEYEPDVADWLNKVRDVAYLTQDVIESLVVDTNYQNQKSRLGRLLSGGRVTKLYEEKIETIGERIKGNIRSFKGKEFQPSHSFKIDEVVGFKDAKETLVGQLIGDAADAKSQLKAILIHGKAGSGKTTLAKIVYADNLIKKHFDYLGWVSLTKALPLEELIRRILGHNSPSNQPDCHYKDDLKARFCEKLKGKRYLVVIDSVHKSDALDELMSLFPDESKGSRILLACRVPQADLQVQLKFSFLYEIKPLDVEQSWQILSRKVLEGEVNPALEALGTRMAEKCKGSLRAIVTTAAILNGREKTEEMWKRFLESYEPYDGPFNYDDLSSDELFCWSYFGLFPEGHPISAKQIIQMWMAEGVLKQTSSKEAEEIGEDYLKKLIEKSFIQIHKKRADKSVKTCSASSQISRLCISKGAAEKFFEVHKDKNPKPQKDLKRMAIYIDSVTDVQKSFEECSAEVHALHCFSNKETSTTFSSVGFWENLLHNFPKLRLLNLGFIELDKVPKVLGKLRNLRYLRLRAPHAKHLPSSIVNLQKLETLDMRESPLISLPLGIWKMQFLRHLYLKGPTSLPKTSNIDYYRALPNLQTLSGVTSDKILRWLMVRAKFPNVRKLRICSSNSELTSNFLNSLDHLYHLQSLRVEKPTELPDLNAFPLSLTKLTLLETKLKPKCIQTLGKLPNLRILKLLKDAISGEELECSEGGFLQLEILYMTNLRITKWKLGEGAMQCVKRFLIKPCDNKNILDTAPVYLQRVASFENEGNGIPKAKAITI